MILDDGELFKLEVWVAFLFQIPDSRFQTWNLEFLPTDTSCPFIEQNSPPSVLGLILYLIKLILMIFLMISPEKL